MDSMHAIAVVSFLFFTGLVAVITWFAVRRENRSDSTGYFLAGRNLTFPFIAGSLLLTNLSTEQMVGLNGSAFKDGLSVMAWEVVAVVALVAMALFFLPRFLRSGIATVPQFLQLRYGPSTQVICNIIFLLAYAGILLPVILYSGAMGMKEAMDLPGLLGLHDTPSVLGLPTEKFCVILAVWMIGIIGAVYALFGGLKTVAVTDTVYGVGLLTGGFMIVYFGLQAVSGGNGIIEGWQLLREGVPEKFHSMGTPEQSVPFATLFTGVLVINMFYWCTNQQIIQRTLAAKDLAEGQKGVLLCGLLKLLGPMYLVLPGIIAFYLYAKTGQVAKPDKAYGTLVFNVLPPYLTGFFAAAMMGAVLSSFNSALNSTTTLFSLGIYKAVFHPNATEDKIVKSGKVFGWIIAIASMIVAPLLIGQTSIFEYIQRMNAIYFIPIFSVVLIGLLAKRVPTFAANVALVGGLTLICAGYFIPPFDGILRVMHEYHFVGGVFALLVIFLLLMSRVAPRPQAWVHEYSKEVDLTPWRGAKPAGVILLVLVITIYLSFI